MNEARRQRGEAAATTSHPASARNLRPLQTSPADEPRSSSEQWQDRLINGTLASEDRRL
jgi:hypothetical protein